MAGEFPFVITVASEKGGVGKTTVATNLAVYLKALAEDLPVTIASFDNHFSVDGMFAIGAGRGASVAELFAGTPAGELARLGEYGVQFLASAATLEPPAADPGWLTAALGRSGLPGILILDTRPILDYFTRSALLAADLVLVPVKDRPSLVNAASLARVLRESSAGLDHLWLLPSLIDARLRLRDQIGVAEYLTFAAAERGYQVLDFCISKSPKVESLITNLSSRVHPVLTHARGTVVHQQLHRLARFALDRYRATALPRNQRQAGLPEALATPLRRLLPNCPVCGGPMNGTDGHFFQDLRSRRRGFVHCDCLLELCRAAGLEEELPAAGVLVLSTAATGVDGDDRSLLLHLYDEQEREVWVWTVDDFLASGFADFWRQVSGRLAEELHRELLLIPLDRGLPGRFLRGPAAAAWGARRRRIRRALAVRTG